MRLLYLVVNLTRRPASADRTARRQFQATGQPVSRTQASDAMTSQLPRYHHLSRRPRFPVNRFKFWQSDSDSICGNF